MPRELLLSDEAVAAIKRAIEAIVASTPNKYDDAAKFVLFWILDNRREVFGASAPSPAQCEKVDQCNAICERELTV